MSDCAQIDTVRVGDERSGSRAHDGGGTRAVALDWPGGVGRRAVRLELTRGGRRLAFQLELTRWGWETSDRAREHVVEAGDEQSGSN